MRQRSLSSVLLRPARGRSAPAARRSETAIAEVSQQTKSSADAALYAASPEQAREPFALAEMSQSDAAIAESVARGYVPPTDEYTIREVPSLLGWKGLHGDGEFSEPAPISNTPNFPQTETSGDWTGPDYQGHYGTNSMAPVTDPPQYLTHHHGKLSRRPFRHNSHNLTGQLSDGSLTNVQGRDGTKNFPRPAHLYPNEKQLVWQVEPGKEDMQEKTSSVSSLAMQHSNVTGSRSGNFKQGFKPNYDALGMRGKQVNPKWGSVALMGTVTPPHNGAGGLFNYPQPNWVGYRWENCRPAYSQMFCHPYKCQSYELDKQPAYSKTLDWWNWWDHPEITTPTRAYHYQYAAPPLDATELPWKRAGETAVMFDGDKLASWGVDGDGTAWQAARWASFGRHYEGPQGKKGWKNNNIPAGKGWDSMAPYGWSGNFCALPRPCRESMGILGNDKMAGAGIGGPGLSGCGGPMGEFSDGGLPPEFPRDLSLGTRKDPLLHKKKIDAWVAEYTAWLEVNTPLDGAGREFLTPERSAYLTRRWHKRYMDNVFAEYTDDERSIMGASDFAKGRVGHFLDYFPAPYDPAPSISWDYTVMTDDVITAEEMYNEIGEVKIPSVMLNPPLCRHFRTPPAGDGVWTTTLGPNTGGQPTFCDKKGDPIHNIRIGAYIAGSPHGSWTPDQMGIFRRHMFFNKDGKYSPDYKSMTHYSFRPDSRKDVGPEKEKIAQNIKEQHDQLDQLREMLAENPELGFEMPYVGGRSSYEKGSPSIFPYTHWIGARPAGRVPPQSTNNHKFKDGLAVNPGVES